MSNGEVEEPEGTSVEPPPPGISMDPSGGILEQAPFDAPLEQKGGFLSDAPSVPVGTSAEISAEEPAPSADEPPTPFGGPAPENSPLGDAIRPRFFQFIEPPPITAPAASGSRAPRRVSALGGIDAGAKHNWISSGPRNVGGRISCMAIHPTNRSIMVAGSAAGGVYRTTDGGETWFPIPFWQDLPSLAIGAIAFAPGTPLTIYAGTGEVVTGGSESIPGNGVYRSDDGGDTWANPHGNVLPGAAPNQAFSFDAIAVHPTDNRHCWAVGPAGVFRTLNGGVDWTQFEAGVYYSDVVFSVAAAAPHAPIVYLVNAGRAGAFVTRLDNPATATQAQISLAANRSRVGAAPPAPAAGVQTPTLPARAKLAICAARPDIAYVRVADEFDGHVGVFRTRTARVNPMSNATPWVRLPDHDDWQDERQGGYNLTIAVDPTNANNVATAMVDLYLSRNANATSNNVRWVRAMPWELYQLDRAFHGDHHATMFAPLPGAAAGAAPALWSANDGGISVSTDWPTAAGYEGARRRPLGPAHPLTITHDLTLPLQGVDGNGQPVAQPPITWRKRSHGITAAQAYDLTQSPLVPALFGCGFQDNGVYVSSGSATWHFVLGADGGFVAFDPDDPYTFLATWQGGISEVQFTGNLLGFFPTPGDGIVSGVWPRALHEGFDDPAAFVADTAHHPRKSGRVLHTRMNRLYGQPATGERWQVEQLGPGLELLYVATGAAPHLRGPFLEVRPSAGARRLGFVPHRAGAQGRFAPPPINAAVRTYLMEPFSLVAGDQLLLNVDGNPITITFNPGGAIANLAQASAAEVAAYIRTNTPAGLPSIRAQPYFPPTGLTVEIITRGVNPGPPVPQITLGGSACNPPAPGAIPPLGLGAGTYTAAAGFPASVMLGFPGNTRAEFVRNRNLTGLELTVQVNGGPVRHIPFTPAGGFPDPALVRTGELRSAIAAALAADAVDVVSRAVFKTVVLRHTTPATQLSVAGSAVSRLNMFRGFAFQDVDIQLMEARDRFFNQNVGNFGSWDLTPPAPAAPFQLVINDSINPPTPPLVFNAALGLANLRTVTAEELQRVITAHIQAIPAPNTPRVRCDVMIRQDAGKPRCIRYAESDPDVVWVGGEDGVVYVSRNDGGSWTSVGDPRFRLRDRSVEAIAIDPRDERTVYLGLAGRTHAVAGDPGFLWKTTDRGGRWDHIGAELVDAAGVMVGVNALEIDPTAPDTVFAATDVGVFRSIDAGAHWAPFNEGLPNVFIRDLAFERQGRTLRAAAWGRGIYERHVGDRAPADVRLYVRGNSLDDGTVRPARDGPELFATTPTGAPPASPDIKVNRDRPPGIGVDAVVDGVEFDEDIVHEEPTPGASHVFVQVHNRGAFDATETRMLALWADAANGPPPLPADFWTKFGAAGAIDPALGPWKLIGDTRSGAALTVRSGYPRVHTFDINWQAADLDPLRRIGILLLVSSQEDPLAATALDVAALLASEAKVGYRETAVVRSADDHRLFLQQTSPVTFTLANPPAGTAAAANLGIPAASLGPALSEIAGGSEPFNLAPAPQGLQVAMPGQTLAVQFVAADFAAIGAARIVEVAAVLNRAFALAGMPVRADFQPVVVPPPPPPPNNIQWQLILRGSGGTTVAIAPPPAPATDAGPIIGFPAGPAPQLVGGAGPFVFPAAGATLQVTATNTTLIQLAATDFADPAHATAREVRRALNRGLAQAQMPVRAIVPKVDLRLRRSSSDADGAVARVAGRRLADLTASNGAVAAAGRPALFDFVAAFKDGQVQTGHQNFLYLRSANLGTAPEPNARHRLFQLAMNASPIGRNQIGAAVPAAVPAGGSAISEFQFDPAPAAAGDRVFVLAIVDVDADGRRVDPPASFATIEELDAFCDANPGAAYREFSVFA